MALCPRHLLPQCTACSEGDRQRAIRLLAQAERVLMAAAEGARELLGLAEGTPAAPLARTLRSAAAAVADARAAIAGDRLPERPEDIAGDLFAACSTLEMVDEGLARGLREALAPALGAFAAAVTGLAHDITSAIEQGWRLDHVPCPACEGRRRCRLCRGAGDVPRALAHLYEAHRLARAIAPEWRSSDDSARPGVTVYSLAAYYRRRRHLQGKVERARGRPAGAGEACGVVELLDGEGNVLARYHGLAWGYLGEGPAGLAAVLADLFPAAFPTYEAARRLVASLPQGEPWAAPPEEWH